MLCNEAEQMQQQIMPFVGGMNPLASSGWPSVMAAQRVAAVQASHHLQVALLAEINKHTVNT